MKIEFDLSDQDVKRIAEALMSKVEVRSRLDAYYEEGRERAREFAKRTITNSQDSELRALVKEYLDRHLRSYVYDYFREYSDKIETEIRKAITTAMK